MPKMKSNSGAKKRFKISKNGKVKRETTYRYGVRHGENRLFDNNGNLTKTELYNNGIIMISE